MNFLCKVLKTIFFIMACITGAIFCFLQLISLQYIHILLISIGLAFLGFIIMLFGFMRSEENKEDTEEKETGDNSKLTKLEMICFSIGLILFIAAAIALIIYSVLLLRVGEFKVFGIVSIISFILFIVFYNLNSQNFN